MSEILYRKVGRRYVPVSVTHDPGWTPGSHLVVVCREFRVTQHQIEPAFAEVEAAMVEASNEMTMAMRDASRLKPNAMWSKKQLKGWEAFRAVAGDPNGLMFDSCSARDVVTAGLDAVRARLREQRST
jgi:hypothetical protein